MAVLIATADGYRILSSSGELRSALAGHRVEAFSPGPGGTWIAVIDRHEIWQHSADGSWTPLARTDAELTCLVTVDETVFAGAVGPEMLRLDGATLTRLTGLASCAGREEWHRVGSDLEVRSLTATVDGVLLANIHVGGIARSDDGGRSWQPTIAVDDDVHEVRAHPSRADLIVAAAAVGLCVSRDAGRAWSTVSDGLPTTYARAVAFDGDDCFMSVSDGPFTRESAIYRGSIATSELVLRRVGDGLPEWLQGNVDTRCLSVSDGRYALADGSGSVWVGSRGEGWHLAASGLPWVASVVVI